VPGWWRRDTPHDNRWSFKVGLGQAGPTGYPFLLILGDEGALTRLAIDACEARGLHYCWLDWAERNGLDLASFWAVLDTQDRDGLCADARYRPSPETDALFAERCMRRNLPLARIGSGRHQAAPATGLLEIIADPVFLPWDDECWAVELLDTLDAGEPTVISTSIWRRSYGPDLIDVTLDLLIDGASGRFDLRAPPIAEADFAALLTEAADADLQMVNASPVITSLRPGTVDGIWLLPPHESTIERFVSERRKLRATAPAIDRFRYEPVLLVAE
jgi:dTDP-4-dehydrorhamnose reductase